MLEKFKSSWLGRHLTIDYVIHWFIVCVAVLTLYICISWKFAGEHYYLWDYGNNYYYENEVHRVVKECVPPYIDSYAYDSLYIIVKQYPKGGWGIQPIYNNDKIKYVNGTKTPYYWIIDINSDEIIGPLDLNTFESKCNSLDIHLQLRKL